MGWQSRFWACRGKSSDGEQATTQDFILLNNSVFFANDMLAICLSCMTQTADPMPDKPRHDFLRDALRNTLQSGDACMEFLVQPRTSNSMDVEDSMTEWKEAQAQR